MKVRLVMTIVCAVFTLGLYTGCKEDPIVKEMEELADATCACEDLKCIMKAASDLDSKSGQEFPASEKDKVQASRDRAVACVTDLTIKYASAGLGGGSDDSGGLTTKQQIQLKDAQEELVEVKGKLAKGEEIGTFDCIKIGIVIKQMSEVDNADVKAVITEGNKACNYEAPLLRAKAWKKDVEAGVAKGGFNSACFDIKKKSLEGLVKSHPEDVAVKELNTYIQANCKK